MCDNISCKNSCFCPFFFTSSTATTTPHSTATLLWHHPADSQFKYICTPIQIAFNYTKALGPPIAASSSYNNSNVSFRLAKVKSLAPQIFTYSFRLETPQKQRQPQQQLTVEIYRDKESCSTCSPRASARQSVTKKEAEACLSQSQLVMLSFSETHPQFLRILVSPSPSLPHRPTHNSSSSSSAASCRRRLWSPTWSRVTTAQRNSPSTAVMPHSHPFPATRPRQATRERGNRFKSHFPPFH